MPPHRLPHQTPEQRAAVRHDTGHRGAGARETGSPEAGSRETSRRETDSRETSRREAGSWETSRPGRQDAGRAGADERGGEPVYQQVALDVFDDDPRSASLFATTFVVVDLETTGGSPEGCGITEIGAVKVRGGELLGTFATLVNPGEPIPPYITVLTGITQAMVLPAPELDSVLPGFLEFAAGAVWVAHNAPYDVGFLKAACARYGYPWPKPLVLDTVALARRALVRDEVPNRKLATLARYFRTSHEPSHRALDDAHTTVDVLHALIGRLGSFGVHTLGEAMEFVKAVSEVQRRQRHLADGLPDSPGVYLFRDHADRPLYIGTSGNIATRVRSYFTAAEKRARMDEMLAAARRVDAVECSHSLEAEVRELRLIAAHRPPYNRRSKYPERVVWLKLTVEPYPRLSIVRSVAVDGAAYLGPFGSRRSAELAADGVHEAVQIRQCSKRLSTRTVTAACALAELGRCPAPCEHRISPAEYVKRTADPFRSAVDGDPSAVVQPLLERIGQLADEHRYEDATVVRGRMTALLRAAIRMQRLAAFTGLTELVAARPASRGGWEIAVVRRGRLAGAALSPAGADPRPTVDVAVASSETVLPGVGPVPCASAEETERILAWVERPETRLVSVVGQWSSPTAAAGRWRPLLERAEAATAEAAMIDRG